MAVRAKRALRAERRAKAAVAAASGPDGDDGGEVPAIPPIPAGSAKGQKGWSSVQLDLDMLKEFESTGGIFLEEADEDEVGVTFADGRALGDVPEEAKRKKLTQAERKRKKGLQAPDRDARKAKKRKASEATGSPDLEAENARLRQELEGLKSQTEELKKEKKRQQEDRELKEAEEAVQQNWVQFDLHPSLVTGLARLGFRSPTQVQARCLGPAIRQRKDICGAAETGSGKTLAFGLPIWHHTLAALDAMPSAGSSAGSVAPGASPATSSGGLGLRALAVLPTRELAVQVQGHLNAVVQGTVLRAECVVGGMSLQKQMRLLNRRPPFVVGTPGRLFAFLGLGKDAATECCDWLKEGLGGLRHLVLDEADRLVESGHFKELDRILAAVYERLLRPQQLQTMVFSATLTLDPRTSFHRARDGDSDGGKVGTLMRRMKFREARAVHLVDLTVPEEDFDGTAGPAAAAPAGGAVGSADSAAASSRLPERLRLMEAVVGEDKDREAMLVLWLLRRYRWGGGDGAGAAGAASSGKAQEDAGGGPTGGLVLLFVNAISTVLRLTSVLALLMESPSAGKVLSRVKMSGGRGEGKDAPAINVDVIGLHSRMRQKDRLKFTERFRALEHGVLVCTDVAARGLDVPNVAAVVHFHAPRGAEVFVHRSGRTARAGRAGQSVALMGPGDAAQWGKVYRAVGVTKEQIGDASATAPELMAAREAARLASDLEGKVHRTAKQNTDKSWLKRAAEEAELCLSEDEDDRDKASKEAPRRALWGLYQQLKARVRRPPRRLGGGPLPRRRR